MIYDESEIEITYIEIDGKKIPFHKIPPGMSGATKSKITDYDDDDDDEPSSSVHGKIYDEENVTYNTDEFIDI